MIEAEGHTPLRVITKEEMPSQEVAAGADLGITHTSAFTDEWACGRTPTINVQTLFGRIRLAKIRGGMWSWPPEALGTAQVVKGEGIKGIAAAITTLLTDKSTRAGMIARQKTCFPRPTHKGVAVETMVDAIRPLLG